MESLRGKFCFSLVTLMLSVWFLFIAVPLGADNGSNPIDKLIVGTTMEVKTLALDDPAFSTIRHLTTHQGLVRLDEAASFTGELAESWQTEDHITWIFTLRQGLTWHDGRPMTARDVQYTIETLPRYIPVYLSHLGMIDKVTVKDPHTVVITLKEPHPRLLINLMALKILPAHIFEKATDPRDISEPSAAIGSGPFIFEFFEPAAGALGFRAFLDYWRGPPHVKRLIFRFFKNIETAILALRKGEIHLIYHYASGLEPFQVLNIRQDPALRLAFQKNLGVPAAVFFNVHRPPLNFRQFREALAFAINYSEIAKLFAGECGLTPNAGFVPPGMRDFAVTAPLIYDPDRARRLLESIGMVDVNGDGFRERDGQTVQVELIFRGDLSGDVRLAQLLQEYFHGVGIRLRLKAVDATVFRTLSDRDRSHMAILTRTTPWGMMMWAGCGSGYFDERYLGWSRLDDPTFTKIVDRMNRVSDPDVYRQAAAELQQYYARELPAIALYWNQLVQPYRAEIEGWKINPVYGFLWEESWYAIRRVSRDSNGSRGAVFILNDNNDATKSAIFLPH